MTEVFQRLLEQATDQSAELHARLWVRVSTGRMGSAAGALRDLKRSRRHLALGPSHVDLIPFDLRPGAARE